MDIKVCRICGGVVKLKNILKEDIVLTNKLLLCLNIKIHSGDLLPKFICEQCDKNLDICYRLKKQCESTQKRLLSAMQRYQNFGIETFDLLNEEIAEHADCEQVDLSQCPDDGSESVKMDARCIEREVSIYNTNTNLIDAYQHVTITEELQSVDARFEENNMVYINKDTFTYQSGNSCTTTVKELTEIPVASEYCSIDLLSSEEEPATSLNGCDNSANQEVESKSISSLTCDTCHEVFTNNQDYRIHIKHHGLDRYQCIQCCKFFPSRFRLKRHEEVHNDTPSHQCSYCNRNYRALYNLQRHIRSAHLGGKNWECNVCNVCFARVDALKRHLLLHSDEKKFICSLCSQRFKTKDYLYSHYKSHHIEKSDITKRSKIIKTDNNYKKNQCGYCGKLFKSSFAFKNHLLIHSNEKPHKCDTCSKPFRTIAALTIHQRIHDDYRAYQCDLCLKSFRQTSHLKEHRALHLEDAPKHVCSICKASFAKKSNLKVHTLTHAKEKAFKCADCSAEFSFMYLLKRHASKIHCRSVQEVYTLNDIDDGACETDDQTNNDDVLQNEMCHYMDTVADDNCNQSVETDADLVDLVTIGAENFETS